MRTPDLILLALLCAPACAPEHNGRPHGPSGRTLEVVYAYDEPAGLRRIPLRLFDLVDDDCGSRPAPLCGTTCAGASARLDHAEVAHSIDTANEVFAEAGIQFVLRDVVEVQAPYEWCGTDAPSTWKEARSMVTQAYPQIPGYAWHDATTMDNKNTNWWYAAVNYFGAHDEIPIVVRGTGAWGATDFPETGRLMYLGKGAFGNDPASNGGKGNARMLAHELGHYMGLRHVFEQPSGIDPATMKPWIGSDQWDLMYRSTSSGPQFFGSRQDAAAFESELQLINDNTNCADDAEGRVRCTVDGWLFEAPDPEISAFWFDSGKASVPPAALRFGRNVLDYGSQTGPSKLSASQIRRIVHYLHFESAHEDRWDDHAAGVSPWGMSPDDISSARHRLGAFRGHHTDPDRNFCVHPGEALYVGDFNGDGRSDLLCNQDNGTMRIDLADPQGRHTGSDWIASNRNFCMHAGEKLFVGDFDDDGADDLLCNSANGWMFVDLAQGDSWFLGSDWSQRRNFCMHPGETLHIGDTNGDGRDDLVCNSANGSLFVDFASPTGTFDGSDWSARRGFCQGAEDELIVTDANGDGRTDLICNEAGGMLAIDYANARGEFWSTEWSLKRNFCHGVSQELLAVDLDGDQHDDLLCRDGGTGFLEVDIANTAGQYWSAEWSSFFNGWCPGPARLSTGDFDGDGREDLMCTDASGRMSIEYSAMDYL